MIANEDVMTVIRLAAVLVLIVGSSARSEQQAAEAPDLCGHLVAFVRDGSEIWVVDARTLVSRTLVDDDRVLCALAWSPDGERLAYIRLGGVRLPLADQGARLCVVALGDSQVVEVGKLTLDVQADNAIEVSTPWWSADGDTLFAMDRDSIYSFNPAGGERLSPFPVPDWAVHNWEAALGGEVTAGPFLSPSGDRVALGVEKRLVACDLATGAVKEICRARDPIRWISWLPQSDRLV